MQLDGTKENSAGDGADREIVVVFREDGAARLASLGWFQRNAIAKWELFLSQILPPAGVAAVGGLVAETLLLGPGVTPQTRLAIVTFLAVLIWFGWSAWSRSLTRRVSAAFDTGARGEIRYVFGPEGFRLEDNLRHWRTGWGGVSQLSSEAQGLFLATKGMVFYLPQAGWPDAATRAADAKRIIGWWKAAAGPTA